MTNSDAIRELVSNVSDEQSAKVAINFLARAVEQIATKLACAIHDNDDTQSEVARKNELSAARFAALLVQFQAQLNEQLNNTRDTYCQ